MKTGTKTASEKEDFKNLTSLSDLMDEYYGKKGAEKREEFELELKLELISEMIKQSRKKQHMTQEELGERIGVKKAQISKLENNTTNVTLGTILKVFEALNMQLKLKIEPKDDPDSELVLG